MKPTKHSVAVVIRDPKRGFLAVQRSDDPDDPLAGAWGFPAITLKHDESELAAAARVGSSKLGVELRIGRKIGDSTDERDTYILHLTDYEATIVAGTATVPQTDTSMSQYAALQFTHDPSVLFEAARKGSLCSQIYLRSIDSNWDK